jgi:hypothetical protein
MHVRKPELAGKARTRQRRCDTTIDTASQRELGRLAANMLEYEQSQKLEF